MTSRVPFRIARKRRVAIPAVLVAALVGSGCVKSYDGTYEPRFTPQVQYMGPVPLVMWRQNRVSPGEFPRAPSSPVVVAEQPASPMRVRSRARRPSAVPRLAGPADRLPSCGPIRQGEGRVRVDCR